MNLYGYIIFVPYCSECSPTRNTRILDVGTGHCPRHYDGFSRLHASARGSGTISVAYAAHTEAQQPTSQLSLARLVGRSSRPRDQGQRRRDLPPRTLHRSVGRGAARGHGVAGTGGREPLRGSRQPCAVVRCERVRSRPQTCPISTEGWTRRVHFVREGGGGGATLPRGGSRRAHTRPPSTHLHHTPGTPERSARKVPSAPAEPSFPGSESTWNSSPWSARGRAEGRSFDCSSTRGAGGQTGRGRVL